MSSGSMGEGDGIDRRSGRRRGHQCPEFTEEAIGGIGGRVGWKGYSCPEIPEEEGGGIASKPRVGGCTPMATVLKGGRVVALLAKLEWGGHCVHSSWSWKQVSLLTDLEGEDLCVHNPKRRKEVVFPADLGGEQTCVFSAPRRKRVASPVDLEGENT